MTNTILSVAEKLLRISIYRLKREHLEINDLEAHRFANLIVFQMMG